MRRILLLVAIIYPALAHDLITTKLTFSNEISRLLEKRCMGCHRNKGLAPFPLTTFAETRPWAVAISDEILARRMPPWNAAKGFNEFRGELALTQEEIQLIADWVNGGAPEGDPRLLSVAVPPAYTPVGTGTLRVIALNTLNFRNREFKFRYTARIAGIRLSGLPKGESIRLVLQQPDNETLPLLWVRAFLPSAPDTYLFREPVLIHPGSRVVIGPSPPRRSRWKIHFLLAPAQSKPAAPSHVHSPVPVAE